MLNTHDSLPLVALLTTPHLPLPQYIPDFTRLMVRIIRATLMAPRLLRHTAIRHRLHIRPNHPATERESERETVADTALVAAAVEMMTGGGTEGEGAHQVRMNRVTKATEAEAEAGAGARARVRVTDQAGVEEASGGIIGSTVATTEDIGQSLLRLNALRDNKNR